MQGARSDYRSDLQVSFARGGHLMAKCLMLSAIVLLACFFVPAVPAQDVKKNDRPDFFNNDQTKEVAQELAKRKWNNSPPVKSFYASQKSHAPAPRRDLTGIWDGTAEGGVEPWGPVEHRAIFPGRMQDDSAGHPDETDVENPLPFTAAGLEALKKNKPGVGVRAVPVANANDPVDNGSPPGFPRMLFYEMRVIELIQPKNQVILLDEFDQVWRHIWTDGRPLPNIDDVEPRFFGYSVGRWTDDYTFEADTVGVDDKTWLDNAGRPHSYEMRVHEIWHRVDYETIELTVTVDDPKYYSGKWNGLNKFVLHRLPDDFDMEEFIYNGVEATDYDQVVAGEAAKPGK
ncbi:MAG: hypothetical protein DMG30_21225 [Acidobacteria bacterium]|nr:MAG: hypothetical protein DMG30_21225 [Acidobacteriota bacterium]